MGTVFSYYLIIDNKFYYTFGNLKLVQQADGMGVSGVSSAEFSFTVSYEEYAKNNPKSGAEVIFGFRDDDKMYCFYVSQRSRKGGMVSFKCYDKSVFFGASSDLLNLTYYNVDAKDENSGDINTLELVKRIADYFSFNGCTRRITDESWSFGQLRMKKADIAGKTVRALLETISAAWCGYFVVSSNNYLDFVFFGNAANTLCDVQTHTAIAMLSERSAITRVIAYTGSDYYYATLKDDNGADVETDVLSTLTIQTGFASQEYADMLLSRVQGYVYRAWKCSKAVLKLSEFLPTISVGLNGYHYPDGVDPLTEFIANSMALNFTATGVYAEVGSNEVIEDEYAYLGYISRKLEEKISDGEKLGNDTLITRYQGIVHLGEKKKDEKTGEEKQNRYGYSKATSDGIVEFDGVIVDKKVPKSAAWNDDKTEAVVDFGGKKYKYKVVKDAKGNVTDFSKEEVKEETQ